MPNSVNVLFKNKEVVVNGKKLSINPLWVFGENRLQTLQITQVNGMVTLVMTIVEKNQWEDEDIDICSLIVSRIDISNSAPESEWQKRWSQKNGTAFCSTTCCDGNTVFIYTDHDSCVIAKSVKNGTERWRTTIIETPFISKLVLSKDNRVLYGNDVLLHSIVAICTKTGVITKTSRDTICPKTGVITTKGMTTKLNLATASSSDGHFVITTPNTEDSRTCVVCWSVNDCDSEKKMYTQLWREQFGKHIKIEHIKVTDDLICVRDSDNRVYVLHLITGKRISEIEVVDDVSAEPVIVRSTIVVIGCKNKLMAFDLRRPGNVLWATPPQIQNIRQLYVVDEKQINAYSNGDTTVFDASSGRNVEYTESVYNSCSLM